MIGGFRSVLCVSVSFVVTVMFDSSENTNRTWLLRAVVSKYRESGARSKNSNFFSIHQKNNIQKFQLSSVFAKTLKV